MEIATGTLVIGEMVHIEKELQWVQGLNIPTLVILVQPKFCETTDESRANKCCQKV